MGSKEHVVLEAFFNEPKHWHFEDLKKRTKLSRGRLDFWLKKLQKEKLIRHVKKKGKMPHYVTLPESPSFRNKKRLFALERFYQTGFLDHLQSLDAKAVIIFGSMARSDWYADSDIDVFILGDADDFEQGRFESRLGREIQVFTDKNRLSEDLVANIASGFVVKGSMREVLHATAKDQ